MTSLKDLSNMSNRNVLITGGVGFLGRIIADTLAELGASIILLDRPGSDFYEIKFNLEKSWNVNCVCIECDLESEDDRNRAVREVRSRVGGVNCLINNAAFGGATKLEGWTEPFEKQSLATWRRALEVNLTAPFHFAQAFAPDLRVSKGGNIVNISSIYGSFGPDWRLYDGTEMGNPAAYGVSKGGLLQLTRWLATTLAPDVRCNAISPGGISRNQPASFVHQYLSRTPLERMATEHDLKGAISYLSSDLSRYVTGQVLSVDGGWGIW